MASDKETTEQCILGTKRRPCNVFLYTVFEKNTCNSAKTFPKLLKLFCVTLDSGATRVSRIVPTQLK